MSCFKPLCVTQYSPDNHSRSLSGPCALSTELCTRQRPELTRSSEHGILSYALSGVWMRVARDIITWRYGGTGAELSQRCNLLTNLALRYLGRDRRQIYCAKELIGAPISHLYMFLFFKSITLHVFVMKYEFYKISGQFQLLNCDIVIQWICESVMFFCRLNSKTLYRDSQAY